MATLAEIRAKLAAQQTKLETKFDNTSYPFWNIPDGSTAILRFLPDKDPSNVYFWVKREIIKIPFAGIKGGSNDEVIVQVPAMTMYGKTCPISAEVSPWWKNEETKDLARKYKKHASYLFQGFVVQDPLNETETPENPIRRFVINASIFNIIKQSLMDPEMEDTPTDYVNGRDFRLNKTKRPGTQWADYTTSKWSIKSRALNDVETNALNTFGLFNLKDYLPKEPSPEELNAIKEMFEASVDGDPYDSEKWGNFYRPFSMNGSSTSTNDEDKDDSSTPPFTPPYKEVAQSTETLSALDKLKARINTSTTEDEPSQPSEKSNAASIIEALKNRQKK